MGIMELKSDNKYLDWAFRRIGIGYKRMTIELTEEEIEHCKERARELNMNFEQFIEFVVQRHMDHIKAERKNNERTQGTDDTDTGE
jgi:hypothetical protein